MITDNDSFKDYPPSVTEVRGQQAEDAAVWTPRDALINALREVDNGLPLTDVLIIARMKVNEYPSEVRYWAGLRDSDMIYGMGLIERFKFLMFQDKLIK
jgi:hypothetical protein